MCVFCLSRKKCSWKTGKNSALLQQLDIPPEKLKLGRVNSHSQLNENVKSQPVASIDEVLKIRTYQTFVQEKMVGESSGRYRARNIFDCSHSAPWRTFFFLFSSVFTHLSQPKVLQMIHSCSCFNSVEKYNFLPCIRIKFSFTFERKRFIFYGKCNSVNTDMHLFRYST